MYIDYTAWETYEYKVSSLLLDMDNPRIRHRGASLNQTQILKILIEKEKVYELAKKMTEEGYYVGEEPIICIENNKKIVLEGNRRVASLKLLQNPKKYLTTAKANILLQNILKNNIPIDDFKIKCFIAPNRLLANPIIYERHKGDAVQKWRTGNQYSFVVDMYLNDGLSIEDICEVLNETRANVLKPLKACNLFFEGKEILEKEGIYIDIVTFDITNLERFYSYEPARQLLGIDFDNDTGELIIKLPQEEFEKRMILVFTTLIDSERFSREFNNEEDKKKYINVLKQNPKINLDIDTEEEGTTKSTSTQKRKDLEKEKGKTTTRKKRSRKNLYSNVVIPRDKEIIFDHEKIDSLFAELKTLSIDKKYAFSVLLRSYLEQSLYFFITEKKLMNDLAIKAKEENRRDGLKKVETLIKYMKGVHHVTDEVDSERIMEILKFNSNKDYSDASLKLMLDYVIKNHLGESLDTNTYKNLKDYVERIKMGLDLAVHNIETIIDVEHNKRAWQHLAPVFVYMSESLSVEEI